MSLRFAVLLRSIARRRNAGVLLVGIAPLVIRALLLPIAPAPTPRVQDEFSHLLAADTFAHGRLVNPPHPMWVHFESMHLLVRPVYASVFPVAPGLAMALGQTLTGHPWAGVWLSVGLMCASLCWMLQGWVPPHWALVGGLLAAVRFGAFSYWMNSYFGGAMAAVGGALVLGAFPRILRRGRWQDAALLAAGLAILANSRPYEGAVFGLPFAIALAVWIWRNRARARPVALALALVLASSGALMGAYFSRFSGNPFVLPYSLYRNAVTMAPHFVWQTPRPEPVYRNRALRTFYTNWEMGCFEDARANRSPHGLLDKSVSYWRFYLGPFLTALLLLTVPWLWKRRRTRYLLLAAAYFSAALAGEVWHAPHYAAPATGLIVLLSVEALRHLRRWRWRGRRAGQAVAAALLLGCLLSPAGPAQTMPPAGLGEKRAAVLKLLEATGERHLAIVRYRLDHDPGDEWVYNSADIDGARVVWAREMDPGNNQKLVRYYAGRRVSLVEPDADPVRVTPYDPSRPPDPLFRFVRLGTPGIEALSDPEKIKREILARVARPEFRLDNRGCDQWNYVFTEVTGVEGPDPAGGCFPPGDRSRPLGFDKWFAWMVRQR